MPCCGRPDNRKKSSQAAYLEKYAYLSKAQKAQKEALLGTNCATCAALTFNDDQGNCSVCGNPKVQQESPQ